MKREEIYDDDNSRTSNHKGQKEKRRTCYLPLLFTKEVDLSVVAWEVGVGYAERALYALELGV